MENEEKEMESFKNSPAIKIISVVVLIFVLIAFFQEVPFLEFIKKPLSFINADNILHFIFIPVFLFVIFFCIDYEIKFDDKHFIYIHGLLKTEDEIYYKDITKVQHLSYHQGKGTHHEYKFFVKSNLSPEDSIYSLPMSVPSNRQMYKKLFQKIFLANSEVKFTQFFDKTFGKGLEEPMDLEEFI